MPDAWIGVFGTIAGVIIGFGLTELTRHIERKRRESRLWSALRAEVEACAALAKEYLDSKIRAPLWRLPDAAYAAAVGAGALSTAEAGALATFYSSVDQLNRGLDDVAEAVQRGRFDLSGLGNIRAADARARNELKATRLARDGEHYALANRVLTARLV